MLELSEKHLGALNHTSSKGNQLKWTVDNIWYKADYLGYEGLVEYVIAKLLQYSSLNSDEFVDYELDQVKYKNHIYNVCTSSNFLPEGWSLITLERIFNDYFENRKLYKSLYAIEGIENRAKFLVDTITKITGISNFEIYLSKILTIDALFLNEDRHMHNIALLRDSIGNYHLCPIFDNGAALLSDIKVDYSLEGDIREEISYVKSKSLCESFDDQLDAVELLYGKNLYFTFTMKDVERIVNEATIYPQEMRERVIEIIRIQKHKYNYLFKE